MTARKFSTTDGLISTRFQRNSVGDVEQVYFLDLGDFFVDTIDVCVREHTMLISAVCWAHCSEQGTCTFRPVQKEFILPDSADIEGIKAKFTKKGVLMVSSPILAKLRITSPVMQEHYKVPFASAVNAESSSEDISDCTNSPQKLPIKKKNIFFNTVPPNRSEILSLLQRSPTETRSRELNDSSKESSNLRLRAKSPRYSAEDSAMSTASRGFQNGLVFSPSEFSGNETDDASSSVFFHTNPSSPIILRSNNCNLHSPDHSSFNGGDTYTKTLSLDRRFQPEHIEIKVRDGVVNLRARAVHRDKAAPGETMIQNYSDSYGLPANVDDKALEAQLTNTGLLVLSAPYKTAG